MLKGSKYLAENVSNGHTVPNYCKTNETDMHWMIVQKSGGVDIRISKLLYTNRNYIILQRL
jgi:hypothetical protein